MKPVRYLIPVAVLAVLAATGVVDISLLPWHNGDFQASLAVVLVYLFWSATSSGEDGADRTAMYAVLLVSTIDSFLLRMTVFSGLLPLRWAGVALLAAGSAMRVLHRRRIGVYRTGRVMQLFGIPLGLGTLAGVVVAAFPGLVFALKEDLPE
ncbi:MAG: hypothetical protein R6V62_02315 [Candidatus Fermentibacteraceae bacterium]